MPYYTKLIDQLINLCESGKSLCESVDVERLKYYASHELQEVRMWTARALSSDAGNEDALEYLCVLAHDEDAGVRVEAVDSLCNFASQKSFDVLSQAIEDDDEIVRMYAAFSIGHVGANISSDIAKSILRHAEEVEVFEHPRVGIFQGQYTLGDENALNKLLAMMQTNDYQIQCAVLNSLEEILDKRNAHKIRQFLLDNDYSCAPYSVVQNLKDIINLCERCY